MVAIAECKRRRIYKGVKKYININCDIICEVVSVPFLGRPLAGIIVTKDYPDAIISANRKRTVVAGKRGGAGICSLLAIDITKSDAHALREAGELLADVVGQPGSMAFWESRVAKAQDAAKEILARKGARRNTEMLSYIAAHEAAGYGPISMLLEDTDIEKIEVRSQQSRISVTHRALGDCVTNMGFSSRESFMKAVGRLEEDAQKNSGFQVVDIGTGAGGPELRVSRARRDSSAYGYVHDGLASPEAAAYLGIAVEAGMNIILTGSQQGARRAIRAIVSLAPPYYKIMADVGDPSEWLSGNANVSYGAGAAGSSMGFYPDRVVAERLERNASGLFKAAMLGRPFLAAMPGVEQKSLPGILLGRPYSAGPELLSKLDVSVRVSASGKLEDITEYHWFERGEAEMEECYAESTLRRVRVASAGALDIKALDGSKAIYEYSKAFMLPKRQAIAELHKRAWVLASGSTRQLQKLK